MKKELKSKKIEWRTSWTFGIALVLILLIVGLVFFFFQIPDRELEVGAEIQEVLVGEDGQNVFIKLSGGLDDGEVEEVKFIFVDETGNEFTYETSDGVHEISVPLKKGFWN